MTGTISQPRPAFSIVSAVYNVDRYLSDFLDSLERQSFGIENLDIILVDDGSTDDSLAICQTFARKHPNAVRVFSQENGGQASARNFGIQHMRGDLVTFIDPDDFVSDDYFALISDYFSSTPTDSSPWLASASFIIFNETTGGLSRGHAMQRKFKYGSRTINLDVESDSIQLNCNSAFFRTRAIEESGLRFDPRIRPMFEDAHFVANYLLLAEVPLLGLVSEAEYFYRIRSDQSSSVATSTLSPERYTDVTRFGLLHVLESAARLKGTVPEWLQHVVLYDLAWSMKDDQAITSGTGALSDEVRAEFHSIVTEIIPHISNDVIDGFELTGLSTDLRFALRYGYDPAPHVANSIIRGKSDPVQQITQFRYRYSGDAPQEEFFTDGELVQPVFQKRRSIEFHGRILAHERIVWVPTGNRIRARLNGRIAFIEEWANGRRTTLERAHTEAQTRRIISGRKEHIRHPEESIASRFKKRLRKMQRSISIPELRGSVKRTALSTLLRSPAIRRAFLDAWVFMDKDVLAGDNAEHLYRYVRSNHPEIKAWFVLNRTSADWDRLKDDGFNLVAYGSHRWKLLLLSAAHFASSHIDRYVVHPFGNVYGAPRWRFTFLQHGVTKDDLSRWLNGKPVDLFVTASPAEYESIVGDSTPYSFTNREVELSGFPRHDGLLARREQIPPRDRNLILIMPTWRKNLVGVTRTTANDRGKLADFMDTEYAKQYTALLNSPQLSQLARQHGLVIAFMPHPNMVHYLADFSCPSDVEIYNFEKTPVQDVLARARILVSDYSSLSFEAALIEVPTVHFQFDRDEFFKGGHIGRKGYFNYERDGFGPVCMTVPEVDVAIAELLDGIDGGVDYLQRMRATFAHHDQESSRRVFEAMLALDTPAVAPSLAVAASVE